MHTKHALIETLLHYKALKFGDFQTKSGRKSPYFFDTSMLYRGKVWWEVAAYLVHTTLELWHTEHIRGVFGAAYKGIPMCISYCAQWHSLTNKDIPFAFSRKESKAHGEKGNIVGNISLMQQNTTQLSSATTSTTENKPTENKQGVLLLDDVLTSGKSLRESYDLLKLHHIPVVGCVVIIDRGEKDEIQPNTSAKNALKASFDVPIKSIINMDDVMQYLQKQETHASGTSKITQHIPAMEAYLLEHRI